MSSSDIDFCRDSITRFLIQQFNASRYTALPSVMFYCASSYFTHAWRYVGHLHRQEMKNAGITELGDKLCWRVGSVCGIDGFAKSIRKASRPSCMFTTYSEDGAEWRKTFYL